MGGIKYFSGTGTGKLVPANLPRENPSMRVISNTEGYLRGQFAGTICGDVLLVYYCTVYTRVSSTRAHEIPAHGTGGLVKAF